jgi:hypothetical protein
MRAVTAQKGPNKARNLHQYTSPSLVGDTALDEARIAGEVALKTARVFTVARAG